MALIRRAPGRGGADGRRRPRHGACDGPAQHRARGVHRVGEVDDLDADRAEPLLEGAALRGAAPVVALEDPVEPHVLPGVELVGRGLGVHRVDDADAAHDLEALLERDERADALGQLADLVGDHAGDEHVAVLTGLAQHVEVPHVEQVVRAGRVADHCAHQPSWDAARRPLRTPVE